MGRHSSDTDSSESERYRKSKKSSSRRHRSRSSSYSRSSRSSPRRRRSRSRSHSSYSREKKSSRSSRRSRSPERSHKRSKERRERRSRSRDRRSRSRDRRSYSRERSRDRHDRRRGHHRSSSGSGNSSKDETQRSSTESSRYKIKARHSESPEIICDGDKLKRQVKKALEAAANADAQLQEQGVLVKSKIKAEPEIQFTFEEQFNRVQTLQDINASGFKQETFVSSRSKQFKDTKDTGNVNPTSDFKFSESKSMELVKQALALKAAQDGIAHDNLYGDMEARQERWIRKLWTMRQRSSAV